MIKKALFTLSVFTLASSTVLNGYAEEASKPFNSPQDKSPSKIQFIQEYTEAGSRLAFVNPNPELPLIDVEMEGKSLFYVQDNMTNNYIVEFPFLQNDYFDSSIKNRINNYNAIAKANPELSIYIYQATNARDTSWFDFANGVEDAVPMYNQSFVDQLDSSIHFSTLEFENWEQYKLQNYKTDHHWSVFGAYHGYTDLISIVAKDHPEIETAKKPKNAYCSNVRFHGSLSDGKPENYDTICEFEYDLPSYTVTVNGQSQEEYGKRSIYKNTVDDSDPTLNHYREFFGKDSAEVIYDYGNNTGINALIVSDSYSNAIKPVLASHFDKTVFIDLRHYLGEFGDYFNLNDYQEKYDLDVMIYIGGFYTTLIDESYQINNY